MVYSATAAQADLIGILKQLVPHLGPAPFLSANTPSLDQHQPLQLALEAVKWLQTLQRLPSPTAYVMDGRNEVRIIAEGHKHSIASNDVHSPYDAGYRQPDDRSIVILPTRPGRITLQIGHQGTTGSRMMVHASPKFLQKNPTRPLQEIRCDVDQNGASSSRSLEFFLSGGGGDGFFKVQVMLNGALMDMAPAESIAVGIYCEAPNNENMAQQAENSIKALRDKAASITGDFALTTHGEVERCIQQLIDTFPEETEPTSPPPQEALVIGAHFVFVHEAFFQSDERPAPYGSTTFRHEREDGSMGPTFIVSDPDFIPHAFRNGGIDKEAFYSGLMKEYLREEVVRRVGRVDRFGSGSQFADDYVSTHFYYLTQRMPERLPEFLNIFESYLKYSKSGLASIYQDTIHHLQGQDRHRSDSLLLNKLEALGVEGLQGIEALLTTQIEGFAERDILAPYFDAISRHSDSVEIFKRIIHRWMAAREDTPFELQKAIREHTRRNPLDVDPLTRWALSIDDNRCDESIVDEVTEMIDLESIAAWSIQKKHSKILEKVLGKMSPDRLTAFLTLAINFHNPAVMERLMTLIERAYDYCPPSISAFSLLILADKCLEKNHLEILPRLVTLFLKASPASEKERITQKIDEFVAKTSQLTLDQAMTLFALYQDILREPIPTKIRNLIPSMGPAGAS